MSSTAASAASTNVAGIWFGELSAVLQGKWQDMMSHGQQQRMGPAIHGKKKAVMTEAAAGAGKRKEDIGECGGAMSDTTVYLLLDRFAPS